MHVLHLLRHRAAAWDLPELRWRAGAPAGAIAGGPAAVSGQPPAHLQTTGMSALTPAHLSELKPGWLVWPSGRQLSHNVLFWLLQTGGWLARAHDVRLRAGARESAAGVLRCADSARDGIRTH